MRKRFVVLFLILAAIPSAALAASSSSGSGMVVTAWGPRFGFSSGPDQFLVGAQLDLGQIVPDFTFTPNADLGIGEGETTVSLNADFHYHFRVQGSPWRPYVGGGIGFIGGNGGSVGGGSILGGAIVPTQSGSRFFAEAKVGLADLPDFKLLVGWNFAMR
jgi:hypothetical protein